MADVAGETPTGRARLRRVVAEQPQAAGRRVVTFWQRNWQKFTAVGLGLFFVVFLLVLAVAVPSPTTWQTYIFRVVLALAAAGIGAVLPGFLRIAVEHPAAAMPLTLRAGGAIALFLLVYLLNPPALIGGPPSKGGPTREEVARQSVWDYHGGLDALRQQVDAMKANPGSPANHQTLLDLRRGVGELEGLPGTVFSTFYLALRAADVALVRAYLGGTFNVFTNEEGRRKDNEAAVRWANQALASISELQTLASRGDPKAIQGIQYVSDWDLELPIQYARAAALCGLAMEGPMENRSQLLATAEVAIRDLRAAIDSRPPGAARGYPIGGERALGWALAEVKDPSLGRSTR
jgi:hypothetical protein